MVELLLTILISSSCPAGWTWQDNWCGKGPCYVWVYSNGRRYKSARGVVDECWRPKPPDSRVIFEDGFETGTTERWSHVVGLQGNLP